MKPLVSIIMIVYDVEAYLCSSIDSVLAQTYDNIELILSVSPGKDRCEEICREYAAKDARIKVVECPPKGPSDARNHGLAAVSGDYLGFVDADDYIESDMIESMMANLSTYDADIAVCGRFYEFMNVTEQDTAKAPVVMTADEAVNTVLSGEGFFLHCWDKLFTRKIFDGLQFPTDVAVEDRVVVDRLLGKADRIVYDSTPKYHFRERSGSLSKMRGMTRKNVIANEMLAEYVRINHPAVKDQCGRFMLYEYITAVQNVLVSDDCDKDDLREYRNKVSEIYKREKRNPLISSRIRIKVLMVKLAPSLLRTVTKKRQANTAENYKRFP